MLKQAWQAVANTHVFFEGLVSQKVRVPQAVLTALVSVSVALLIIAIALVRISASAAIPVILFVLVAGLINWLLLLALGGLVIMRPAQLDVRAWELVAWAWTPAAYIALSLLLVTFYYPVIALVLGIILFNGWHLSMLYGALRTFAPDKAARSCVWYAFSILLAPWLLLVSSYLLLMANR